MVEWQMEWTPRELFPNKPEKEMVFNVEHALAHLMINEVLFLNNHWMEKEWPEDAKQTVNVLVICNDTFAYACADCERLPFKEIEPLYRMWQADPTWGPTAWCVMRRKERPIGPVEKGLREKGYDVDSWLLNENTTNAEVQASFAWAAAKSRGLIP